MGKQSKQEEKGNRGRHLGDAAVKKLARTPGAAPKMKGRIPEELVHELQVHQIELEMQNEELKKAQLALVASRDKYVDLYDFAPVGYFAFTPGALIAEVNLTGAALLGVELQKLKNRRFKRFVAPEDLDQWDRHIVSVLHNGKKQTCDLVLKRQDGFTFPAQLDSIRLDLPAEKAGVSGRVSVVCTAVSDITERKKGGEELRKSEERFRALAETTSDMIWEVGKNGVYTYINQKIKSSLGYDPSEIIGKKTPFDVMTPEDKVRVGEIFRAIAESQKPFANLENWNLHKDGRKVLFETSGVPIFDSQGQYAGYRGIDRDITERKLAEEVLKESEQKFRTIFDNASDGMFIVDLETRKFLMCNARCLEMLGYAQEEFLNLAIPDIHPPDDLPLVFEEIAKFMKGEEGVRHDLRFRRKDGSEFFCDISPSLVTLAGRKSILLVFQDISERKKAEEERRLNEHRLLDLLELYKIASFKEKAILDFTLEASQRSLQSEFGFLGFISADEAEMTIQAWTRGVMEQCALSETPLHFPIAQSGLWGEMVRQRRPIIVNSYDTSNEFKKGYPTGHVTIKRFLGIPVFSGGKIACVAAVANKVSEYTASDVSAFTALINEMWHIVERIKIQNEKRQANEELVVLVKKLENRNHQNTVLSEMREMLQACSTMEEAAPIIRGLMERLYPDSEGALFMMSPSRSDLESVARWGDFPEDVDDNVFAPDACWALRRGRTHLVENVSVGPLCPHLKHPPSTAYMCLPLIAKGDVLGLLHLRSRQSAEVQSEQNVISDLKDMAVVLSEYLSLSIANIQLHERLASQSVRDPLTGLFNRRFMMESLEREIKRAERNKTQVSIIMADIDHFKQFNDKYGHAAGDKVLAQMGGFFKAGLRGSDVACRYGGEEFVFFLAESSAENTFKRADQMREGVKNLEVHYGGELPASITLSMGISTYPDQGSNAEDLLRVADAALYRAKQEGRDRVIIG